jgi:hypothetical protein
MPVIIDGSAGITTPGVTDTGNLSVAGTTTLTTPLPVASGGTGGSATPTAGGIVYGTGTVQAVTAAGTAGQVLQSNGASAPTWVTPSAGAMTLISTQTASASSSIAWTGLSGYTAYLLIIENFVPSTGADQLILEIGTGAGPTYITSGYYCSDMFNASNSSPAQGSNQNNGTSMDLCSGNTVVSTVASGGLSAVLNIVNMDANPSADVRILGKVLFPTGTTIFRQNSIGGTVYNNTTAKTAIKLSFSGYTIASGRASLYGISS